MEQDQAPAAGRPADRPSGLFTSIDDFHRELDVLLELGILEEVDREARVGVGEQGVE